MNLLCLKEEALLLRPLKSSSVCCALSLFQDVSDDEILARIGEWDGDGDGSINFSEFLEAMTKILTDTDNEERMREAFNLFDKVICMTFCAVRMQSWSFPVYFLNH